MLGIVTRAIASYLITQIGCTAAPAQTGAVTLIQRFGSALNLNIHCHRLFLDGVYGTTESGPRCRRVKAPRPAALDLLVHPLSDRIARHLERRGHSNRYRIVLGPPAGRQAFT